MMHIPITDVTQELSATLHQPSVGANHWSLQDEFSSYLSSRSVAILLVVLIHVIGLMAFRLSDTRVTLTSEPVQVALLASPKPISQRPILPSEPVLQPLVMEAVMPEVQVQQVATVFAQVATPQPESQPIMSAAAAAPVAPVSTVSVQRLETQCPVHPAPAYPTQAKRLREQGTVVLGIDLDSQGRLSAVQVTRSSGSRRLDEAGIAAMRNWQCRPALHDGQPVAATARHEFEFVLTTR